MGIKGCGVIETRFIIPPAGASFRAFWRELQSFLAEVVRDDTGEYPQAADFLKLMKSIERKVESDAE